MKALEIDPSLAEARAPLAYTLHYYDWNWSEAEAEYGRCLEAALKVDPNLDVLRPDPRFTSLLARVGLK